MSPGNRAAKILKENLAEEEEGDEPHPELWLRFTDALGISREDVRQALPNEETKALVDGYYKICRSSYARGLAALFTYEQQVPKVAQSKINGLKEYYGITDEEGLRFFNVHLTADEWHSQECAGLLEQLPDKEKEEARFSAIEAAKLLWNFLDGVDRKMASL